MRRWPWLTLGALISACLCSVALAAEEDDLREVALQTYLERCDIDPDSAAAQRAPTDDDQLLQLGYYPEQIRSLVEDFPEGCSYISFKAAVMGEKRKRHQAETRAFRSPEIESESESESEIEIESEIESESEIARESEEERLDPDDLITSDEPGLRGLPQGLHDDYTFGIASVVISGIGLGLGALFTGLALQDPDEWHVDLWLMRWDWTGPSPGWSIAAAGMFSMSGVFGVMAAVVAGMVEGRRDRTHHTYRDHQPAKRYPLELTICPTGLTLRF